MKDFICYLPNGKITKTGNCEDDLIVFQPQGEELVMEGIVPWSNAYVEDGIVKLMPESPGEYYIFNYDTKQWEFNQQLAISKIAYTRDTLLANGPDRINPIWWASMTEQQQNSWIQYRQALLDITSQPNYPYSVVWPIKPQE